MKIFDNSQLSLNEETRSEGVKGSTNYSSLKKETSTSPVIDIIPFSVEGIQTVVKNQSQNNRKRKSLENGFFLEDILRTELQRFKDENVHLRNALKEASKVNQQWRNYHDQRQGYVQKLLATIHDLQQAATVTQTGNNSNAELNMLKETLSRQQKDHREHIQLLQLQVKAHRDDWEAERSEKITAETARALAESQVASLREQLEQSTIMLEELENRLQYCHCFSALNSLCTEDDASSLNEGSLTSTEYLSTHSPVNLENGINGLKSRSRSSSNSGELSAPSSPSPIQKHANKLTIKSRHGGESSKDGYKSPTYDLRNGPLDSLSNIQVYSEDPTQELIVQSTIYEMTHRNLLNGADKNARDKNISLVEIEAFLKRCEGKEFAAQNLSHFHDPLKRNGAAHSRETRTDKQSKPNTYYESKGARPKLLNLGKKQIEDEKQAKHRARSILASALPLSPSASAPSSPVSISLPKMSFVDISKDYFPITSTIFSAINNSTVSLLQKLPNSTTTNSPSIPIQNGKCKDYDARDISSKSNNFSCSNGVEKLLPTQNRKCIQTSANLISNNLSSHNGCPAIIKQLNEPEQFKNNYNSISINQGESKHIDVPCGVNGKSEIIEIEAATFPSAVVKCNKKVTKVGNRSHDKLVTNYATISVMPGPSSAVCSNSQGTSTGSSRSSSPGISLTTFALNANGQGVPGAMFLALGTENTKPNKSTTVYPNYNESTFADQTVLIKKEDAVTINSQSNALNGRLVNSTWVKLMDKENTHLRSSAGTPWRTARAVPSHQLNSVKRHNHEENSTQENNLTNYVQISRVDSSESPKAQYESGYNGSASVAKLCIASSHSTRKNHSDSDDPTELANSSSSIHFNSPSTALAPHGGIFQFPSQSRSDLVTMASRNISSAILNYEYGNKFQRPQT